MIFLVSGEGPSDIGTCTNQMGECSGADFRPGPMAVIIDQLVEREVDYSPHAYGALEFVSETALDRHSREIRTNFSAGKKRGYETGMHYKSAFVLGKLAEKRGQEENCPTGAVLFRDADGTRSTERGRYESVCNCIEGGFAAAEFPHGVPMVPKPKSEAWIICALKGNPYENCAALEESLPGNDNAPNPAKEQQKALLSARGREVRDLIDMVGSGEIDHRRIDMPSFNRFRDRLNEVARAMISQ